MKVLCNIPLKRGESETSRKGTDRWNEIFIDLLKNLNWKCIMEAKTGYRRKYHLGYRKKKELSDMDMSSKEIILPKQIMESQHY